MAATLSALPLSACAASSTRKDSWDSGLLGASSSLLGRDAWLLSPTGSPGLSGSDSRLNDGLQDNESPVSTETDGASEDDTRCCPQPPHVCAYTRTCTFTHGHPHTCAPYHACAPPHACTHTCTSTHMHAHLHMHVYTYVCVSPHACAPSHTCAHPYTLEEKLIP